MYCFERQEGADINLFGSGAIMRMGDDQHEAIQVYSTGSLTLDIALGIGGLPQGRVVEIYGPEASGKTTIARVVAKIYCGLGLLKKETVREVHRADLIGQHIGETEAKTNAIIDSALDGVLFLDEAYALSGGGKDGDWATGAAPTSGRLSGVLV